MVLENKSNFLSNKIGKYSTMLLVITSSFSFSSLLKLSRTKSETDIAFSGLPIPIRTLEYSFPMNLSIDSMPL